MPTFPITVSVGSYAAQSSGVANGIGPFNINATNRYLLYNGTNSVQGVNTLGMIKSIDNGVTWNVMDEAGAPPFDSNNSNSSACYDGSRYIYAVFMELTLINHGIVNIARFDTQTDTWGVVVVGPTSNAGSGLSIMNCWVSAISQVALIWDDNGSNSKFQLFDPGSMSFGATATVPHFSTANGNIPIQMVEGAGGVVHFLTSEFGAPVNTSHLVFCSVTAISSTFSAAQSIGDVAQAGVGLNGSMVYDSTTGLLTMAWQSPNDADPGVQAVINIIQGTSGLNVAFAVLTTITSASPITGYNVITVGLTQGSQLALFWTDDSHNFYYSQSFAAPTILGNTVAQNIQVNGFVPATTLTGYALAWANTGYWELTISPPPPPVSAPVSIPQGPNGPTIIRPNDYTMCLVREYRLFKDIDYTSLECCRPPDCIIQDYVDPVGIGWLEPDDGRAFNPTFAISLPDPTDGEVTLFTEPVPLGYDGMILAQFHGYIQAPSGAILSSFSEGSGDIAWRVTSNNRYVKDCGNMLVSIGSTQRLAPIYGGIRVRSGDILSYRVQVYNLSGLLTPGLGSVIAGLHGYFYPRK